MSHFFRCCPSFFLVSHLLATLHALELKKVITGGLSPKSVVHAGNGLFFAQNMMYSHTITVYNRRYEHIKTIPDSVELYAYGYRAYPKGQKYRGAPVEASFTHGGKYIWVSQYQMYGPGFSNPGHDRCTPAGQHDPSFVYKINTENFVIEKVIKVGAVPKFQASTPDSRYVLVANWCSWDISVIDTERNETVHSVKVGRYPRGIAITKDSAKAYIAVMGSYDVAVLDLKSFELTWLRHLGRSPRHLLLSEDDSYLYVSFNGEGKVGKVATDSGKIVAKINTGSQPRSMVLSDDGRYLYVVNYGSDTVSKIDTQSMVVLQTVKVNHHPIGIAYDGQTKQVWVACYSGSLMIFQD
ncbi:MAG: YncE family protein [Leptospiraceae bacterium]|nr:YncE family protein [Leptospiraceae bacterium]MDW8307561.1 YncE family protein [Leptospiraceae bacterium]